MGSARQDLARRERLAFEEAERSKQRDAEDQQQYEFYLKQFQAEQERVPKALKLSPLSFEEWRKFIPQDQQDATLRGLAATSRSLWKAISQAERDNIAASKPLSDEELAERGFDLSERVRYPDLELSLPALTDILRRFIQTEPRFDSNLHYTPVTEFIANNDLFPSVTNLRTALHLLLEMGIVPEKPQPEGNPELNEYQVNLRIKHDPEFERQQQRKRYYEEVVCIDPRDGKEWTQFMLDRTDSETFKRLMFGEHSRVLIRHAIGEQQR